MDFMNNHTFTSLDIKNIFDRLCLRTPYGIEQKNGLKPFRTGEEVLLEKEFDSIECIMEVIKGFMDEFREISFILKDIKEIRGSIKRAFQGIVLDEVELFEVKKFIFTVKDLCSVLEKIDILPDYLRLYRNSKLEEVLDPEGHGDRTFYIYDSYSEELYKTREKIREFKREYDRGRKKVISCVEEFTGIRIKLNGEAVILKKDEERLKRARECSYLSEGASTLVGITFKIKNDDALNKQLNELEGLKSVEERLEYEVRRELSTKISAQGDSILKTTHRIGKLDLLIAKAELAIATDGVRPVLHEEASIIIKGGRHLRLEEVLNKRGKRFTPVSFTAYRGVTVITGANMGGKTVNLKTAGLLTAMAHFGIFVPAAEFKTCLFDYIYFSIGDLQSIDSGLSTFGSEIQGMIEILNYSLKRGLILIDELARGTNPKEGYAISRAIVRYLKDREAVTIFTTHFEDITLEEGIRHLQVKGLKYIDFNNMMGIGKEKSGIYKVLEYMDYTLEEAQGNYEIPEDAINIARLMGLDEIIVKTAEEIMNRGKGENNGQIKS